jgi:hypothetical protein
MGVWDARTHIPPREFFSVVRKLILSRSVLLYALRAPFLALRRKPNSSD